MRHQAIDLMPAVRRLPDIRLLDYAAGAIAWFAILIPLYSTAVVYLNDRIAPDLEGAARLSLALRVFFSALTSVVTYIGGAVLIFSVAYRVRIVLIAVSAYVIIAGLIAWRLRVDRWINLSVSLEDFVWEIPYSIANLLLLVAIVYSALMLALTPRATISAFFKTNVRSIFNASLLGTSSLIKPPRGRLLTPFLWGVLATLSAAVLYYVLFYGIALRHFQLNLLSQLQACAAQYASQDQTPLLEQLRGDGAVVSCAKHAARTTMWTALTLFVVVAVLLPVAMRVFGWLRWRSLRQSLLSARSVDPRPPVLYLRPFAADVDRVAAGRDHLAFSYLAPTRLNTSIEGSMLESLSTIGPVVAIGNPAARAPTLGAAREYVGHDQWRDLVTRTIQQSRVVVIVVGDTPGIAWEIEQAFHHRSAAKLLVFPPSFTTADAQAINAMLRPFEPNAPEITADQVGMMFNAGNTIAFSAGRRNAFAYEALARFVALSLQK